MTDIFQVAPPLSAAEYESLKVSITEHGVLVPVEKDGDGNIIDGHHRVKVCEELGKADYPTFIRLGMTDEQKRTRARVLNAARRQFSQEQKRCLVAWQLKDTPEKSNRQIAAMLGVNHETVGTVRGDLESTGGIRQLDKTVGTDGKSRPASRPATVFARTEKEAERAFDLFPKMDTGALSPVVSESKPDADPVILTLKDVHREARAQDRAEVAAMIEPLCPASDAPDVQAGEWWRLGRHLLYCGDSASAAFRDACPSSIPFAFADPPYNVEKAGWDTGFIWAHDYIADVADVVAVTPGTRGLVDFLRNCKMPYRWIFTAWIKNGMTVGGMGFQNALHALLFSHSSVHRNEQDFMELVISTSTTDDTAHPTRKPLRYVARLMQIYSSEGDSVLDPFLGSGTTLWAAEELGRACIGAEISPAYCAEIIGRWQAMTGLTAMREG